MKRTEQLYRTAVLLLLLMLAAACTRDDTFDDAAPGNATGPAAPLTITVTDGAYVPEASAANAATDNGAPVTRAVENGFATEFTKGDQIGLYVADAEVNDFGDPYNLQITTSNLCLTYDGTRWTLPAGTELKYDPAEGHDILYFAYYPYQANMNGNEPDGYYGSSPTTTAPKFFHELIYFWKAEDDQSTYAKYTACDLMMARGKVATRTDGTPGSTLSFKMEHQMTLAVIRLPHTTCTYTETIGGEEISKSYNLYTGGYVDMWWQENHYTARRILRPDHAWNSRPTSYYYDSKGNKHMFAPNTDYVHTCGQYKTYTVDGGAETTTERPLAEGDFYMKDGTVLPQEHYKNSDMPQNVKDDCIGVVFWVGEKTNREGDTYHWTYKNKGGDRLLMYEHPACTHGLVVALTDAADAEIQWSSTDTGDTYTWLKDYAAAGQETEKQWLLMSNSYFGYNMTRLLRWYRDAGGHPTEALGAVEQYARANATPDGCSGWYFPGDDEMTVMARGTMNFDEDLGMAATLNAAFTKAGGRQSTDGWYWSSTDGSLFPGEAYCIRFSDKARGIRSKQESHYVRAVLAF